MKSWQLFLIVALLCSVLATTIGGRRWPWFMVALAALFTGLGGYEVLK